MTNKDNNKKTIKILKNEGEGSYRLVQILKFIVGAGDAILRAVLVFDLDFVHLVVATEEAPTTNKQPSK